MPLDPAQVRCVDGVITADGAWPRRSLRAAAKVSSADSVGTSCSQSGAAIAGGASVAPAATAPPSSCRLGTAGLRIAPARKRGANARSRCSMVLRPLDLLECTFLTRYCPQRAMRYCSPEAGGQCGSQEVDLKLAVQLTLGPCAP